MENTEITEDALTGEFIIEPFVPGELGEHVMAGIEAAKRTGVTVDVGPFGTTVTGGRAAVLESVAALLPAALNSGATRLTLTIETRS
jgi:uncharacterized protein YqgV (UPF0045/DUF77 family)